MAQDLHHLPLRIFSLPPVGGELYHDLMAGDRTHIHSFRNEDIHGDPGIIRDHKAKMILFALFIHADHRFVGPLQYLYDGPLRPAAVSCFLHCHLDRISVHGVSGVVRGDEQIGLPSLHGYKAKSLIMGGENACLCKDLCPGVFSFFRNSDLPIGHERLQHRLQLSPVLPWNTQKDRQLLQLHGNVGLVVH